MDDVLELLTEMIDEWEDELIELDSLIQTCPDLELECLLKKETLEECIDKVNSIIGEFTIIE